MTKFNLNTDRPYFRIFLTIIVCSLAFIILWAFSGCTGSKELVKNETKKVEEVKIDSTEYYKEQYNTYRLKTEAEAQDMNYRLAFEQHNTDALLYEFGALQELYLDKTLSLDSLNKRLRKIFDSISRMPCKSTLKVDSKGGFEATGVSSFNLELLLQKYTTDLYKDSLSKERELRLQAEKKVRTKDEVKTIVKKQNNFWWGFVAGFLTCLALIVGLNIWAKRIAGPDNY